MCEGGGCSHLNAMGFDLIVESQELSIVSMVGVVIKIAVLFIVCI